MATGVISWSQTAATNASADATINFAEGQAPSTLNDSVRALMASVAKYRDDISGSITTAGTSTAYTVTSNQGFTALAAMHNQIVAFVPHTTNGATVTLNVDGLGAKPLRSAPSVELPVGTIVQGTPYLAYYNNTDGSFYLHGFPGGGSIPLGSSLDHWGSTAPGSNYALMYGQAISRTTYAALFVVIGVGYGAGDGSTTFNLPDCRGRVLAGADNMGGSAASRITSSYFGGSGALGSVGGAESHTLNQNEIPAHAHTINDPGHTHSLTNVCNASGSAAGSGVAIAGNGGVSATNSNTTGITINNAGGGLPHAIVQPTIVSNKIMRIL